MDSNLTKSLSCVTMCEHRLSFIYFLGLLSECVLPFFLPFSSGFGVRDKAMVNLDNIKHTPDAKAGKRTGTMKLC